MKTSVLVPSLSKLRTQNTRLWQCRTCRWTRDLHDHVRQRRDDFWSPTVNLNKQDAATDSTQLLVRAGYLRQAYAGVYHMLPLGLRVQEKLERLIDKHMRSVGASKVSLSSLSSQALWQKSGRLETGGELFRFEDRKSGKWLLAPTHEEEITTLLANAVHDRRQLPVRLYQISRKYRDEKRPRGGLLRGREFIMKDLYTFDKSVQDAHATYEQVRNAYRNFLDELGVPYIEARADSGNMGGKLSHEYHFPSETGEDTVITCDTCDFARNEEFVNETEHECHELSLDASDKPVDRNTVSSIITQDFISKDGAALVRVLIPLQWGADANHPAPRDLINSYAVKEAINSIADIDTGIEDAAAVFQRNLAEAGTVKEKSGAVYYLVDKRVNSEQAHNQIAKDREWLNGHQSRAYIISSISETEKGINLLRHAVDDPCPDCSGGKLKLHKAIEVGHTFHLGTRYSSKLSLTINLEAGSTEPGEGRQPVQMGCHGIGVSRLLAAATACLSSQKGLMWPRVIAPFDVVLCTEERHLNTAHALYDKLASSAEDKPLDVLLDDRQDFQAKSMGYKLKDAVMVGYPIVVVLGKAVDNGKVEVQCERLGVREDFDINDAPAFIRSLVDRL